MGLYITGSLTDGTGNVQSNFYSNIVHYFIDKGQGTLNVRIGSYNNKEAATSASPIYVEDFYNNDSTGYFPTPVKTGSYTWGSAYNIWHLTQSVTVNEIQYSSSWQDQLVDYIDFDEDGNEITVQRNESIEVITSSSVDVQKSLINLNEITGSVYTYAYTKVKDYFKEIYGVNNVQDDN